MKSNTNALDAGIRKLPMGITMKIKQGLAATALALMAFSAQAGTTGYFIYDESGHLLGEYDANGQPVQEHIYVDDRPVAVAVTTGSTTSLDYVTTDQLDTPRDITDGSGAVIWTWDSDPFGNGQPTGSITYNLRFPGQYYDAETGHNYNMNRDYDPASGRYVESDPIGLGGGINTYVYVASNPLIFSDPFGLAPIPLIPPNIPGGPWTPAPGQPAGYYYGPQQSAGPRAALNYVPPASEGGHPSAPNGYWKMTPPGQPTEWYNGDGELSTPGDLHPQLQFPDESGGLPAGLSALFDSPLAIASGFVLLLYPSSIYDPGLPPSTGVCR